MGDDQCGFFFITIIGDCCSLWDEFSTGEKFRFQNFIIAFGAHLEQLSILELVGALLLLRIAFTWFCCCLSGDSLSIAVNFNNLLENNE